MSQNEKLDCRGLACPQPVLRSKELVESAAPQAFEVLVDNEAARQNVTRFLEGKGYAVTSEARDGEFVLHAQSDGTAAPAAPARPADACEAVVGASLGQEQVVVFLASEHIGRGDDALGGKLMGNFLATLPELGDKLWRIVLVNSAVKLATQGNPALDALKKLADAGVSILVCGTCLDHFGLLEAKQIGETTNMLDVVTSLELASKIIKV